MCSADENAILWFMWCSSGVGWKLFNHRDSNETLRGPSGHVHLVHVLFQTA